MKAMRVLNLGGCSPAPRAGLPENASSRMRAMARKKRIKLSRTALFGGKRKQWARLQERMRKRKVIFHGMPRGGGGAANTEMTENGLNKKKMCLETT